ncbi:MAG: hypothetical protein RSD22_10260 [Romboutsia sp.]
MQDLKNNKRRATNKKQAPITMNSDFLDDFEQENLVCEVSRGCKPKQSPCNNDCECNCECNCNCNCNSKKDECEPCDIESKVCFDNKNICGPSCCNPIIPQNVCISNAVPYAIETNRVFDTMRFQTFTDATEINGGPVYFETEVVEVEGNVPLGAQVGVTIDKICINYSEIEISPGYVSLEDYEVEQLRHKYGQDCKSDFEFSVCGDRDSKCCSQGKGKSASYKQRGLVVEVEDLVLELRGKCGCTEFVAIAYPVAKKGDCKTIKADRVRFVFNTLSAPICLPADGRNVTLRQGYQTNLTVDCIGKSLLSCECCDGEKFCRLDIPNGIDLILCLQETVSILIPEQIVVLGAPTPIDPRIVDTFSKVCDFKECGTTLCQPSTSKKGSCGC